MTRRLRSAVSTRVLAIGGLLLVLGAFTGLAALVPLIAGDLLGTIGTGLGGVVLVAAGALVAAWGWRSQARVDATGVAWATGFGATTRIPWEAVDRVLVPGPRDRADTVALRLRDGAVVPVTPLRRTQSADAGTGPSPWFTRAGEGMVAAHRSWLAGRGR